jgi:2-polyprenyl-3-methyl-5-hydroxy-6-metoxy-1,4-benzoquinol methylase
MSKHLDNLVMHVPDLFSRKILDVGSGRGKFLIEMSKLGADVSGLEKYSEYIEIAKKRAQESGTEILVVQGAAESLPFLDNTFGFLNVAEVIEHVEDPEKTLKEIFRVATPGALAYISVPSRFSLKDTHFHLYFVNWIPRSLSDTFISFFSRHKEYGVGETGRQRLSEMHYYTYNGFKHLAEDIGFTVYDARFEKIKRTKNGAIKFIAIFIYLIVRWFYFDTFHLILRKGN